jgi:hypothetical protein
MTHCEQNAAMLKCYIRRYLQPVLRPKVLNRTGISLLTGRMIHIDALLRERTDQRTPQMVQLHSESTQAILQYTNCLFQARQCNTQEHIQMCTHAPRLIQTRQCNTQERIQMCTHAPRLNVQNQDLVEDLGIDGRILKWIFKKCYERMWMDLSGSVTGSREAGEEPSGSVNTAIVFSLSLSLSLSS